jgi:peptidyl-prolyl cis-trans isomerase A (cyclophilin A)
MTVRTTMWTGIGLAAALAVTAPAFSQATGTAKPTTQKPAVPKPPAPKPSPKPAAAKPAAPNPALMAPSKLKATAPATYLVNFDTTAGPFVIQVTRAWAPKGADRFYNLVRNGYYDNGRFFRVIPNFMVQFGINGDPKTQSVWREANITDDPVKQSNKRGYITFATSGPDSRTTQVFINFRDNAGLDQQGFAPFGQVISGMEAVDKITSQYGERPDQGLIQMNGNAYLSKAFPNLDYVRRATIAKAPPPPPVKK